MDKTPKVKNTWTDFRPVGFKLKCIDGYKERQYHITIRQELTFLK